MKRLIFVLFLAIAVGAFGESPKAPAADQTPAELRLKVAQQEVEIAQLKRQLLQAEAQLLQADDRETKAELDAANAALKTEQDKQKPEKKSTSK